MNIKNKIIEEYQNEIDISYLDKYLLFIQNNKKSNSEKNKLGYSKTSLHHILPKAKGMNFSQYSNLKIYKWNGVHLEHKDHYYAHFLLCKIFKNKNYSMNETFLYMHNSDIKLNRITEDDLISGNEYQELYEKALILRGKKISEHRNTNVILEDGTITTNALLIGKKISASLNTIGEDGLTPAKKRAMNRNFISVIELSSGIRKCVSSEEYQNNKQLYKSTAKEKYSYEENLNNTNRQIDYKSIEIFNEQGTLIEIFDPSKNGSFRKWLKNTKYPNNFYDAMNENKLACIGKNIKKEYKSFKGWKISKVYK